MCSIIGSFDLDKIKELAELNAYRGQHSFSIARFDKNNRITHLEKCLGELPVDTIELPEGEYCIVHQQAPTTESKNEDNIHPAEYQGQFLWHNGIVKDKGVKDLQTRLKVDESWDTKLILMELYNEGLPNGIDGTFSCIWYDRSGLHAFRNEISPLFVDENLNVSSTKFDGSEPIKANTMFNVNLNFKYLTEWADFYTVENPYYFG